MFAKIISVTAALVFTLSASAQQVLIPAPPQLAATAYLLLDAETGEVLVEHNADQQLPPASLTNWPSRIW